MENESTFVAPEGVYSVTEDHKPSFLQAHTLNNPPILYPTKLSTIVVRFPPTKPATAPGFAHLLVGNKDSKKEVQNLKPSNLKEREDGASLSSSDTPDEVAIPEQPAQDAANITLSVTNEPHNLFSNHPGGGKKKMRPKHNIRTTSSTFITRMQSAEGVTKLLQSKQGDVTFWFCNVAKSFVWMEAGAKSKEPLARITFSAYPTCHDVNPSTASHDHLDIIIGFNTGDLIWFDPMSSRYARLNKQGSISNSPCTSVRWVPTSSTLFLVSHADGTIMVYDKEREDGTFTPQDPHGVLLPSTPAAENNGSTSSSQDAISQGEWNPLDNIFVTMPPWHPVTSGGLNVHSGKPDKDKIAKNPVSHWRVSRRSVVDFVFSPDVKYVAAISEDGCLRVIDALAEQLVDCHASYFGALTCVAWSPDGRFILTGGQDDLLTLFSPWEQRVVARCQGHSSFVSAVAFDELRCDTRTYRFGSVGEDNKLILWDFSSGALHRPKLQPSHHQRTSMSSTVSLAFRRDRSAMYLPSPTSPNAEGDSLPRYHPAPARSEIAVLQSVLIKHMEGDLLTSISFLQRGLLTATKSGNVKLWVRPLELRTRQPKAGRAQALESST